MANVKVDDNNLLTQGWVSCLVKVKVKKGSQKQSKNIQDSSQAIENYFFHMVRDKQEIHILIYKKVPKSKKDKPLDVHTYRDFHVHKTKFSSDVEQAVPSDPVPFTCTVTSLDTNASSQSCGQSYNFETASRRDSFTFFLVTQRCLEEMTTTGKKFVVRPFDSPAHRQIGSRGSLCFLHVCKSGLTLAFQTSHSILAQWPLNSIRNYESTGSGCFQLEAGRRSPMGHGLYKFSTAFDGDIYQLIDRYVNETLAETRRLKQQRKAGQTIDDKIYDEYCSLRRLAHLSTDLRFSRDLQRISQHNFADLDLTTDIPHDIPRCDVTQRDAEPIRRTEEPQPIPITRAVANPARRSDEKSLRDSDLSEFEDSFAADAKFAELEKWLPYRPDSYPTPYHPIPVPQHPVPAPNTPPQLPDKQGKAAKVKVLGKVIPVTHGTPAVEITSHCTNMNNSWKDPLSLPSVPSNYLDMSGSLGSLNLIHHNPSHERSQIGLNVNLFGQSGPTSIPASAAHQHDVKRSISQGHTSQVGAQTGEEYLLPASDSRSFKSSFPSGLSGSVSDSVETSGSKFGRSFSPTRFPLSPATKSSSVHNLTLSNPRLDKVKSMSMHSILMTPPPSFNAAIAMPHYPAPTPPGSANHKPSISSKNQNRSKGGLKIGGSFDTEPHRSPGGDVLLRLKPLNGAVGGRRSAGSCEDLTDLVRSSLIVSSPRDEWNSYENAMFGNELLQTFESSMDHRLSDQTGSDNYQLANTLPVQLNHTSADILTSNHSPGDIRLSKQSAGDLRLSNQSPGNFRLSNQSAGDFRLSNQSPGDFRSPNERPESLEYTMANPVQHSTGCRSRPTGKPKGVTSTYIFAPDDPNLPNRSFKRSQSMEDNIVLPYQTTLITNEIAQRKPEPPGIDRIPAEFRNKPKLLHLTSSSATSVELDPKHTNPETRGQYEDVDLGEEGDDKSTRQVNPLYEPISERYMVTLPKRINEDPDADQVTGSQRSTFWHIKPPSPETSLDALSPASPPVSVSSGLQAAAGPVRRPIHRPVNLSQDYLDSPASKVSIVNPELVRNELTEETPTHAALPSIEPVAPDVRPKSTISTHSNQSTRISGETQPIEPTAPTKELARQSSNHKFGFGTIRRMFSDMTQKKLRRHRSTEQLNSAVTLNPDPTGSTQLTGHAHKLAGHNAGTHNSGGIFSRLSRKKTQPSSQSAKDEFRFVPS